MSVDGVHEQVSLGSAQSIFQLQFPINETVNNMQYNEVTFCLAIAHMPFSRVIK